MNHYTSTSAALKDEIASTSAALKGDLASTSTALKDEIASTSAAFKGDLASTSTALKDEIASTSAAFKGDLASTSTALKDEIASTSASLKDDIARLREDSKRNVVRLAVEIDKRLTRAEFQEAFGTLNGKFDRMMAVLDRASGEAFDNRRSLIVYDSILGDHRRALGAHDQRITAIESRLPPPTP